MNYGTTASVLKPLDEIALPDPRFEHEPYRPRADAPLNAADIHERLQTYSCIHKGVPERVRTQFETARNLMLYAYFVFEFQTQAQLQAYAALEFALREKFGHPTREIKRGDEFKIVPVMLKALLQRAVKERLIQPERLPSWEWANQRRKSFANQFGQKFIPLSAEEWLEMVQKHVTDLRNHIAHGNPWLDLPTSFNHIELCADIINALFPNPDENASPAQ